MRRFAAALSRDWPLKLGAIGLATLLYAGVALSENVRTWPGPVPIEVLSPPSGGSLLEFPGSVGQIRYRAPFEVASRLTSESFRASIDLSVVEPRAGAPPVEVPVRLFPVDPRVEIVDFSPRSVNVRVDQVVTRRMPVTIDYGVVPEGISLGSVVVDPATVVLEGASSRLATVRSVVGLVAIDASGINVDQEVGLEALDGTGALVAGILIRPPGVRVTIAVARQLAYATLPVVPDIRGQVAPGWRIAAVALEPQTVTVSGEEPVIRRLTHIPTAALDLAGISEGMSVESTLALPDEVTAVTDPLVRITISLEEQPADGTEAGG